jgi:single-strand DNA-binding protein
MRANNVIMLSGRLGADPEIRTVGDGKQVASFTLAVTRSKTETDWFKCTAWNNLAELAEKYLKKGNAVAVVGSVRVEKKEEKTYFNVIVDGLEFLGGGKESSNENQGEQLELVGVGSSSKSKKPSRGSDEPGTLPPF